MQAVDNNTLMQDVEGLQEQIYKLKAAIKAMAFQNEKLRARIEDLEAKVR